MRSPLSASDYPSLRDEPCRYPDARSRLERRPYLYRDGKVYAAQPHREGALSLEEVPIDLGSGVVPLGEALGLLGAASLSQRVPLLALGSNAYPRQLLDKFEQHPVDDDSVLVLGCTLSDAAIVYCASLSLGNGYVPVSLAAQPGAETHTWIQWLTGPQLEVIARTEGQRYALVECGRAASVGSTVTLHGLPASTGPAKVYGWLFDSLLTPSGVGFDAESPEAIRFAGNPPEGYPGHSAGVGQDDVLEDVVDRALRGSQGTLTWDGCAIPTDRRQELRDFLATQGVANGIPAHWSLVDRSQPDFAQRLLDESS
jgi:hypothetical protein